MLFYSGLTYISSYIVITEGFRNASDLVLMITLYDRKCGLVMKYRSNITINHSFLKNKRIQNSLSMNQVALTRYTNNIGCEYEYYKM